MLEGEQNSYSVGSILDGDTLVRQKMVNVVDKVFKFRKLNSTLSQFSTFEECCRSLTSNNYILDVKGDFSSALPEKLGRLNEIFRGWPAQHR